MKKFDLLKHSFDENIGEYILYDYAVNTLDFVGFAYDIVCCIFNEN
jgi:hypothetical protein